MMEIHNLIQGTLEWKAHRRNYWNASDAPAMMGCSPHTTRNQLMTRIKTGIEREVDAATQERFDNGHRFEALARPLAEEIIGEDLYPMTGSRGRHSASFDGLTGDDATNFEHKTLNALLREWFDRYDVTDHENPNEPTGNLLPLDYRVQIGHQMLVSESEQTMFMASEWDKNTDAFIEMRYCWYKPDPELHAAVIAGWVQLEKDLETHQPSDHVEPAKAVGKAPETLPALFVRVKGEVLDSNLADFKRVALGAIRSVNLTLDTDEDFDSAKMAIKWCEDIESRAKATKEQVLGQTATIDQVFKTLDDVSAESAKVRVQLKNLIDARNKSIRIEQVQIGTNGLAAHIIGVNQTLDQPFITGVTSDFPGAIKGLSKISSIKNAIDTELAKRKIEVNALADRIRMNCRVIAESGQPALFADIRQLVAKDTEDLKAIVQNRVVQHRGAEAAKEEATRQRIRAEEVARLEREAKSNMREVSPKELGVMPTEPDLDASPAQAFDTGGWVSVLLPQKPFVATSTNYFQPYDGRFSVVVDPKPYQPGDKTMRLGQIQTKLGLLVTEAFLESLGIKAAHKERNSVLYREADFSHICMALMKHVNDVMLAHDQEVA